MSEVFPEDVIKQFNERAEGLRALAKLLDRHAVRGVAIEIAKVDDAYTLLIESAYACETTASYLIRNPKLVQLAGPLFGYEDGNIRHRYRRESPRS